MMWEACAEKVRKLGGEVMLGRKVYGLPFRLRQQSVGRDRAQCQRRSGRISRRAFDLIDAHPGIGGADRAEASRSRAPGCARFALSRFPDRGLIVHDRGRFTDNWIYIHDPSVQVGRVQNYKSWSPEMVPDAGYCSYGLEYFCFEGDGLWTTTRPGADRTGQSAKFKK